MAQPDDEVDGMLRAIAVIEAMIRKDGEGLILHHEADQEEMAGWLLAVSSKLLPKVCGGDEVALWWLDRLRESVTRGIADPGGGPGS
jgi:hypothetical protein